MTQPIEPSGLNLWERVQTTDPAYTRGFTSSTGFNGTSIAPVYLVRKATDVFGPMGIGWGIDIVEGTERYKEGAPIGYGPNGEITVRTVVHSARFELWYILGDKTGKIRQWGSTTFVGRANNGEIYTNEDAEKMSQTDAMSKCLSLLGLAADVHLGLFDDAKYVAGIEAAITDGRLAGANLQRVGNGQQQGNGGAPGQQGSQDGSQLSKRYQSYRERMKKGAVEDVKAAREVIQQDSQLDDMEKALLLSSPELKLEDKAADAKTTQSDGVFL